MLKVRFKRMALVEFNEAVVMYEGKSPGLGRRLRSDVFTALTHARRFQNMYFEVAPGLRRIVLQRYPSCIYYRPSAKFVSVQAFLHGHIDTQSRDSRLSNG